MHDVELADVPPLGRSLRSGAFGSARALTSRNRQTGPLPDVRLVARGLHAEADRLTDYQHLIGANATDALPSGFVHVLAFPVATALMVRPDFPLPLLGMVHLSNVVTQHRPVDLGEELDVTVHAENLTAHRRGAAVDLVAEVRVDDELAWRGVSTYLAKGWTVPGPDEVETPGAPSSAERPTWHAPTPTGRWVLPSEVGVRYAEVSGDHNPIHTSTLAAKAFGFPRTLAHGMYTASRALAQLGAPESFTWSAQFFAPVLLPGTVSVRIGDVEGHTGAQMFDAWGKRHHLHVEVAPLT
jgi:acyl dehydratase